MDNIILYGIIAMLLLMNFRWVLFFMYPFMVINGYNRNRTYIGKLLASPYLVCERILGGGDYAVSHNICRYDTFFAYPKMDIYGIRCKNRQEGCDTL